MTAKEYAQRMMQRYIDHMPALREQTGHKIIDHAKQCCLMSAGEIKKALIAYGTESFELQNMDSEFRFWDEVVNEINKL